MKKLGIILLLFTSLGFTIAQALEEASYVHGLHDILDSYAERTGERILVDPRVKARFIIHGQSIEEIGPSDLLTLLNLHFFAAYKNSGYTIIVPANIAKYMSLEMVKEGKEFPQNQMVTDVIPIENVCPNDLEGLIRPILSPVSHYAASTNPRLIVITATYSNTVRVREIVSKMDSLLKEPKSCAESEEKT